MAKMSFTNQHTAEVFERDEKYTFEAFAQLTTDLGLGRKIFNTEGKEISVNEANDKIREKFFEVLDVPVGTKGKDLRRAFRRHKVDVFEVTEDIVDKLIVTGWGENPFFNEFVEVKNAALGDTNEFYTPDKVILSVSEVSNDHTNIYRQRLGEGQSFSVKVNKYAAGIYVELERFLAGKVDWASFVQKVYEAFDKKFTGMIYATLSTVGTSLPAGGQWVKTGPLSDATKDTLVQLIDDVKTANGTDVVIMGTKVALSKLANLKETSWISEKEKEERYTTGRVGLFEGVRLAEIPQVFADNDTTTRLVANDKLWIMPVADNKFIKVFYEGDPEIKEGDGSQNTDNTIDYSYQVKMGIGVIISRLFGIWNITSSISG